VARHPQYLGYTLLSWGFALLSGHWVAYVLGVASTMLFYLQALQEEGFCLAQFGQTYERYRQRVPRYNILWGIARLLRGGGS
jgi:protein-S-isoprenylcysteine O-methyltransferase Ste14